MAGGLGEEVVGYCEADTCVVLVVVVQGTDVGSAIKEFVCEQSPCYPWLGAWCNAR